MKRFEQEYLVFRKSYSAKEIFDWFEVPQEEIDTWRKSAPPYNNLISLAFYVAADWGYSLLHNQNSIIVIGLPNKLYQDAERGCSCGNLIYNNEKWFYHIDRPDLI